MPPEDVTKTGASRLGSRRDLVKLAATLSAHPPPRDLVGANAPAAADTQPTAGDQQRGC